MCGIDIHSSAALPYMRLRWLPMHQAKRQVVLCPDCEREL
jgi:hypothetical protein